MGELQAAKRAKTCVLKQRGLRFGRLLQRFVQLKIAIFVVPRNRVTFAGEVDADLVGAAGFDGDF